MLLGSIVLTTLFTYHSAIILAHDLYWTDDRILEAVTAADNFSIPSQLDLIRYGDRAFPAFERLLEKPAMDGRDSTGRIIGILRHYKSDRSRFLKHAVQALTRELSETRITALLLIAQIGSEKEASAVVALLSDEEVAVAFEAGDCLIAIGTERELIAFDITLRAEQAKGKTDRDWLKTKRDKLKERLERDQAKLKAAVPSNRK